MDNIFIKDDLYSKIHQLMPILCVDVVVTHANSVLLIKRSIEPVKDGWWFPGGRILRNEHSEKTAVRIVKQETNLNLLNLVLLGTAETFFDTDPFGHGNGTHTINIVYHGTVSETEIFSLILDDLHSKHSWVKIDDIYNKHYLNYIKKFVAVSDKLI